MLTSQYLKNALNSILKRALRLIYDYNKLPFDRILEDNKHKSRHYCTFVPPRVRLRATVKLSAAFFHHESSITKGGYESAIAPKSIHQKNIESL